MRSIPTRLVMSASTALSFVLAAGAANAQTTSAPAPQTTPTPSDSTQSADQAQGTGGLEEIVVTARRSSESLINVPVAVTAVDSQALARANVTSLESAAALVPFVTIARVGSGNGGFMSIRGIASTPQDTGAQQSVLSNVDYVLIGRGRLATMAMFDIAQVEVLKGPQALYYGKNTTAGVFSITSNDPGNKFGGYIRGGYEFDAHQRYVDAAIDAPISDDLRMRVAGHYSKMRGWIYNAATATTYPSGSAFAPWIAVGASPPGASNRWGPDDEEIAGRVTLVYEPSSKLTAKLKYTYAHTANSGGTLLYQPYCRSGLAGVISFGLLDPNSDCKADFRTSSGDLPKVIATNSPLLRDGKPYSYTDGHIASLNIDYQLADHLKLSAISGYYNVIYQGSGNFSPSVWAGIFTATRDTAWALSQELRLSSDFDEPVNFEIGGFVDKSHQSTFGNAIVAPAPADPTTGRFATYDRLTEASTHSYSVFGRINWDIVKNLTLSGGVRYTTYYLDSTDGNQYVSAMAPASLKLRPAGSYFVRNYKDSNYSPEISLTWHPAPSQTLYATYKTGYKSGGFSYPSVLNTTYTIANTTFKPERATSLEAGYKAELFDRRLRVDLSAYRTTVSNQQLSSFNADTFSFIVSNAGKSRVQGVELQLTGVVAEGLQVFGSVGYNDGKYLSFPAAQCAPYPVPSPGCVNGSQNLSGRVLPRAPKWAGNFGATYETPVGSDLKLSLNGMGTYSSSYYSLDSLDPNSIQKGYVKWDAGIAIGAHDDKWRLSLQGRNLGNKYVTLYSYEAAAMPKGSYISVPQRGRQIALEAAFKF